MAEVPRYFGFGAAVVFDMFGVNAQFCGDFLYGQELGLAGDFDIGKQVV